MKTEYKVTAREIDFQVHGLSFLCIFGTHVNGGYVSILNWGVSAELSSRSSDVLYNRDKILEALQRSPDKCYLPYGEENQRYLARDLSQMITERLQEIKKVEKENE